MSTGRGVSRTRLLLLALGGVGLVAGLAGGLVLAGTPMPPEAVPLAARHGELMTLGFLGTVIALERAVALDRRWGYLAPVSAGLGAAFLAAGASSPAALAFVVASLVLLAIYAAFLMPQRALHLGVQGAGAGAWLVAALLLAAGRSVSDVVPWLVAFLVMTVVGERLELARLGGLRVGVRRQLIVALWLFVLGVTSAVAVPDAGSRVAGLGLVAIAAWLVRNDLARRTVWMTGVTRYIAVCLLAGYAWLAVGGLLWAFTGTTNAGLLYDARLHALFLGFVISMVFGHAPIIVPAVLRLAVPYHRWSYLPLALLHAGLLLRVSGDLLGVTAAWQLGAESTVLAIPSFVGVVALSAMIDALTRRLGARSPRPLIGGYIDR